jgi:hypothetical protein
MGGQYIDAAQGVLPFPPRPFQPIPSNATARADEAGGFQGGNQVSPDLYLPHFANIR